MTTMTFNLQYLEYRCDESDSRLVFCDSFPCL